jgi:MSHA biogenesis protein MshQ
VFRLLLLISFLLLEQDVVAATVAFLDDFERTSLGSDWTVNAVESGASAAISTAVANSGTRSMYTRGGIVYVTSRAIDLSASNFSELSIWIRMGADAYSERPSAGDDLEVDIYLSDGSWKRVALFEGPGNSSGDIYNFSTALPDNALHANFSVRFHQIDGTSNDHDYWHIDDVTVTDYDVGPVVNGLFYDGFERAALGTTDWSISKVDSRSDSSIGTQIASVGTRSMYTRSGEIYVTTRAIDLSPYDFVQMSFWVRSGSDSYSEWPSLHDDLHAEILLENGIWQRIGTYLGSGSIGGDTYEYYARLPTTAYHSNFKLRFHQIDGSTNNDFWHIDEVFVGYRGPALTNIDHYLLTFSDQALTCNAQDVEIKACLNADCSTLYTDDVDVTLTPSGWTGSDTVTISGGTANVSLRQATTGTVTLGATSTTPAADNATQCIINGGTSSLSCDMIFSDSGFVFSIPDFLAAKGATGIAIQAVKKSDASEACIPAFASVSKTLDFWSDYVSPNSVGRPVSWPVVVNGVAIGASSGTATPISLAFDATGSSIIDVNYADAGQMEVEAKYNGSGADAGLVMTGNNSFVSRPAGMCVSATTTCSAGDASCPKFMTAGTAFPLSVQAVAWQTDGDTDFCAGNGSTPNYSATGVGLSAAVLSPSPANSAGAVSPASYDHGAIAAGTHSVAISESEVGVFRFDVTPPSYFGYNLGVFSSEPIGRFYPDHFAVSVSDDGSLAANCSTSTPFSYSGEEITWLVAPQLTITAKNSANVTTQNYTTSGYLKLLVDDIDVANVTADSSAVDSGAVPLSITSIFNTGTLNTTSFGELTYDFSPLDLFTYTREARAEINSFTPDILMSITDISDSDGVAMSSSPLTFTPLANMDVRFGRLWLEDSYGPEIFDVVMPLRTEYFDGTRYQINLDDSCTAYSSANASVSPTTLTQVDTSSGVVISGVSGASGLVLLAPTSVIGTPDTGKATVTYATPSWLQGDYDNNGSFEDARGTVSFGVYRGHNRVIYRKEIR